MKLNVATKARFTALRSTVVSAHIVDIRRFVYEDATGHPRRHGHGRPRWPFRIMEPRESEYLTLNGFRIKYK